ncbi:MAG TPA: ABC transporter permease [Dehalococcoidia bacterium]|jgi:peptide/nickel transport system permease protein
MTTYIIRRVLLMVLTIVGVSFLTFSAVRLMPGSFAQQLITTAGYQGVKDRAQLNHKLGLDQPLLTQYAKWIEHLVTGDLGHSLVSGRAVSADLAQRIPVTLELGILSIVIGVAVGLPIGIVSAIKQNTWIDYVLRSFSIGMLSIPGYWIATLVIVYSALWFSYSTPLKYSHLTDDPLRNLQQMWMPALILGVSGSAALMRFTRTSMLEVLRYDYVRTARAKGMAGRVVIGRHALRNALIPVITLIGVQVGVILGGSVIFETIFSLPGMGVYLLNAVNARDYPLIQATVLLLATGVILMNFLTDIAYCVVDPRIRY